MMNQHIAMCPECLDQTLETVELGMKCSSCAYVMERVSLSMLKEIFFKLPMKAEEGDVKEGDSTTWEFFWCIVKFLVNVSNRDLWVAGWKVDGIYVIKGTNEKKDTILYVGSTPEEATENLFRGVTHELSKR